RAELALLDLLAFSDGDHALQLHGRHFEGEVDGIRPARELDHLGSLAVPDQARNDGHGLPDLASGKHDAVRAVVTGDAPESGVLDVDCGVGERGSSLASNVAR